MDHPNALQHEAKVEGRNWVQMDSKHFHDKHGHGTHIAGIILDYIEHASIYIAKVTEGATTDPHTLAQVSRTVWQA